MLCQQIPTSKRCLAKCSIASLLFCFLALPLFFDTACAQEKTALQLNQPVERSLNGGETHSFLVTAQAGQFLSVSIEQRGIDVAVRFAGSDGKQLAEVNLAYGTSGTETACWIAETAGDYRIEIVSLEKSAQRGRYQLRLAELRAATDADRNRVAAQTAFMQAEDLYGDNKPESRRQAIAKYAEAVKLWQTIGEKASQSIALYNIGDLYRRSNDYPKAIEHFNQSLELDRASGDIESQAVTLNTIGVTYSAQGDKQEALNYFNQALPLRRQAKDRSGEAGTLNAIAVTTAELGDRRKAINDFQQVLSLRKEIKDRRGEAVTLNNIAANYQVLGEKRKAVENFSKALEIFRALRDQQSQANTLSNLGTVYSDLGEQQKALDHFNQALPLWRNLKNARGEALTQTNMGRAYDLLGAQTEAINLYNQSLPVFRNAKDRLWEGRAFNFLGLSYWASGEYQKALEQFNLALPIKRELKDVAGEAATLNNLGLVYDSMGDRQKALESYNQALPLLRSANDRQGEAKTLNNIGSTYDALGDKTKAMDFHQQSLRLSREVGDRQREAKVHYGIARIESSRNNLKPVRKEIEQTIKIVESLRSKLTNPELRATYRASLQQYYDLYIDVLMRMGKRAPKNILRTGLVAEALQVSESARARSLVELLSEANADIRQGVDAALVERERELQEQINEKTTEQIRLLGSRAKAEQVASLGKEIEQLNSGLRDTQAEIRRTSPRYAALTQPQPLTLGEIQKQVLNPWSLLLEYSLGEERSYLWVVGQNSISSFTLPKRSVIEAAAKRFYDATTARNQFVPRESSQQKQDRIAEADAESLKAAAALSRLILSPAVPLLGSKRLIVVADGALQYVPFAALPVGSRPLVSRHEIVSLPSATTLTVLRAESAQQQKASKTVAVFADPVFEAKDERVKVVTIKAEGKAPEKPAAKEDKPAATAESEPTRILLYKTAKDSGATNGELRIPRLPNTRREAETILSLTSGEAGKSIFDFAANRTAATGEDLSQYQVLHFATHGFLNSLNPELSGLVMSLVDEQGKPQNGYLLAPEIYNLKLPATELVVLSACQTGLGKEVRGEGIVGLTRGFMYAGSPRVIVSLWSVNDRSTSDLMKHFYEALLSKGQRPAAALRSAQLEMLKQKQWQAPYFWSAFGLQGEWR